ncbi:ALP1-like protein [Tanacetum coccineum]
MAYDTVPNALDEYLQMGATTARGNLNAFFGVYGMNNDVNVLRQSAICNDLKAGKAPDVLFVANDVAYKRGYYLTDRIHPKWSVLIKSISNPRNDHKRIMYKTVHEAARKDLHDKTTHLSLKADLVEHDKTPPPPKTPPLEDDELVEEEAIEFWQTATVKTVNDREQQITVTVDGHKFTITEASVRRHLQIADVDGLSSLPNTEIFKQLSQMGYLSDHNKLTFKKA